MSTQEKFTQLKEQLAKLKQQLPPVAEKVRNLKLALPKVFDPILKAKKTLESRGADSAQQDIASLQQELQDLSQSSTDIDGALTGAADAFSSSEQGLKDAHKETASSVQRNMLSKLQGALPSSVLDDAKTKIDNIKDRVDKSKTIVAKLEGTAGPVGDALKKAGTLDRLKSSVDTIAEHVPALSGFVGQTLQKLPGIQNPITQAVSLLGAGGKTDPKDVAARLAKVQEHASAIGQHISGVSSLMSKGASAIPAVKERLDGIQKLVTAPATSDTYSHLTKLADEAVAHSDVSGEIAAASQKFADASSMADESNRMIESLAGEDLLPDVKEKVEQIRNSLDQARQQLANASSLVNNIAKRAGDISSLTGKTKNLLRLAQGQKLASDVVSGNVKPEDLLKQLLSSQEFQGVLQAAQGQFPEAVNLISKAQDTLKQIGQGLNRAQNLAAALQQGDLTAAAVTLQASPQAGALLQEAAKQFPEAAGLLKKAQASAKQVREGIEQAKGALAAFQKGDYAAVAGTVAAIPVVKDLLADAQKQFPETAALASQALGALPQIKEGLQQANQAVAAIQAGDYSAALQQLKAMPAVQSLLAEAQEQFPEAAALAQQAQQNIAAVQEGLTQSSQAITAFQNGDTDAALAQLKSIPAVQSLLQTAQDQFPQAHAMLSQASALLPEVQEHLNQASALMDAAIAGDLTQLAAVQEDIAAAHTAVAAAVAAETGAVAAPVETPPEAVEIEETDATAASGDDDAEGEVLLTISTPLGDGKFDVINLQGDEQLSDLFAYRVEVVSKDKAIDFAQIVGQSVTVYLDLGEDEPRYINGIVTRIVQWSTDDDDNTTYVLEMRPWLWKLTKTTDCRIYQNQSAIDIITGLFDELGFADYTNSTTGTYKARDYCVQYRETAFNFVSRLMEESGIFYFFKHEDGKHTLTLADDSDSYPACHVPEIEYDPTDKPFEDEIIKVSFEQEITTAKYVVDDFNFETSTTDLLSTADGEGMQWYEYPAGFTTTDDGTALANRRLAAMEAAGKVLKGSSTVKTLVAGSKFTLTEHERDSMNAAYVVRKVSMKCDQQKYEDAFEAIPASVVFRPPVIAPKPIIHGSQTAIVVGKSGEEIWVDKYGRVKVQFHWDQKGKNDENSSCWVRVAQGWAGKSWGMVFLPRIGDEVVVSFLEGNPDRPLITGSVYNAQNTVPYTLPDDQTKSTIKSMSSKQGTAGNELRFQDLKDSEEFFLHAQKDMKAVVEHDWIKHVKNSEQTFVQSDDPTAETDFKHVLVVDGKRKITIKGDSNEETHTNEGKFTHTVTKEFTLTVNGDTLTITASGDLSIKGKTVTIESSSGDVTIKSASNLTAQASQSLTNKAGTELTNQAGTSLTNKSGTDLTNQAGTSLTNKASISLTNDGGVQLTNKASATQECDGGGMLALKGGMVKLN